MARRAHSVVILMALALCAPSAFVQFGGSSAKQPEYLQQQRLQTGSIAATESSNSSMESESQFCFMQMVRTLSLGCALGLMLAVVAPQASFAEVKAAAAPAKAAATPAAAPAKAAATPAAVPAKAAATPAAAPAKAGLEKPKLVYQGPPLSAPYKSWVVTDKPDEMVRDDKNHIKNMETTAKKISRKGYFNWMAEKGM
eukprot:TRINITY_DN1013_c0_g1_i1.p1 TRINITY_DN1013_c0_g1~~TRINITY_DN1013_c0_g1_i1.p1  ORF type:complete len:225 (+),score=73.08 TRINITY_DN1013_c0_g1_i1:83-676(+)